jgi:hypothetical protein
MANQDSSQAEPKMNSQDEELAQKIMDDLKKQGVNVDNLVDNTEKTPEQTEKIPENQKEDKLEDKPEIADSKPTENVSTEEKVSSENKPVQEEDKKEIPAETQVEQKQESQAISEPAEQPEATSENEDNVELIDSIEDESTKKEYWTLEINKKSFLVEIILIVIAILGLALTYFYFNK